MKLGRKTMNQIPFPQALQARGIGKGKMVANNCWVCSRWSIALQPLGCLKLSLCPILMGSLVATGSLPQHCCFWWLEASLPEPLLLFSFLWSRVRLPVRELSIQLLAGQDARFGLPLSPLPTQWSFRIPTQAEARTLHPDLGQVLCPGFMPWKTPFFPFPWGSNVLARSRHYSV